jgi:CheY-like chemotaxis protein
LIIKEHHGTISILESELNVGTIFEITLPRTTTLESSEMYEQYPTKHTTAKILWVEDDAIIRRVAKKILKKLNFLGDVVACGSEALDMLQKDEYNILITDLGMPNMNGDTLAKLVRERFQENIYIIINTGWSNYSEEGPSQYADIIIPKPIDIEKIQTIISDAIRKLSRENKR